MPHALVTCTHASPGRREILVRCALELHPDNFHHGVCQHCPHHTGSGSADDPSKPTQAAPGRGAVGNVARGAVSIAKTQILRRSRISEDGYQARLAVCRDCPGGHAVWKQGDVHTCGPMLQSIRDKNQRTCGCILRAKARDRYEDCPFGYWPKIEGRPIQSAQHHPEPADPDADV